jgi:hypothetical protein
MHLFHHGRHHHDDDDDKDEHGRDLDPTASSAPTRHDH